MFAIVDIETCGGKFAFRKGRIIDICILVHDGLQVVDKFSTLIIGLLIILYQQSFFLSY